MRFAVEFGGVPSYWLAGLHTVSNLQSLSDVVVGAWDWYVPFSTLQTGNTLVHLRSVLVVGGRSWYVAF